MKLFPVFRAIAILSYLFIPSQGMMMAIPFGCILLAGLFEAEPLSRIFMILADIALLTLFVLSFNRRTKKSLLIELAAYPLLMSPFIRMFSIVPVAKFNYLSFIILFTIFAVFYPLSVLVSLCEYRHSRKTTGGKEQG